jgi:hypothetical protein
MSEVTVLLKVRRMEGRRLVESDPKPQFCEDVGAEYLDYVDGSGNYRSGWFLTFNSQPDFAEFWQAVGKGHAKTTVNREDMLVVYV